MVKKDGILERGGGTTQGSRGSLTRGESGGQGRGVHEARREGLCPAPQSACCPEATRAEGGEEGAASQLFREMRTAGQSGKDTRERWEDGTQVRGGRSGPGKRDSRLRLRVSLRREKEGRVQERFLKRHTKTECGGYLRIREQSGQEELRLGARA